MSDKNQNLTSAPDLTKGEQTRLEIIQAAMTLFSRQGYHGTSMRQIAADAGVALGGIYNHFDSKEDIFQAVSFAYHPIHAILPALEAEKGESVEEVVRYSADKMYETLSERQDFMNLMFIEAVEFKGKHFPEIFTEMFPRALGFGASLREKRGTLRQEIPLQVMVMTFIGLNFVFYIFFRTFGALTDMGKPKKVLGQMMDIFLYGILSSDSDARKQP
jgi:AcrR family transcriptional regulator